MLSIKWVKSVLIGFSKLTVEDELPDSEHLLKLYHLRTPEFKKKNIEASYLVATFWFQLCLHSPDTEPTGPLKMETVQGDGIFNAWSRLFPPGPPLLSQDAACTNILSVTGWKSPEVKDDTRRGLWAWKSQRRSSEMFLEQDAENKPPGLMHESCLWSLLHWEWQIWGIAYAPLLS